MIRPVILLTTLASLAFGDNITLITSPLETSGTGPFTIDFQFDSADQAVTNSVTLADFTFGGGSLVAAPSSETGGILVGTSPFSVRLTNSSFFNDVQFTFTPGSALSFDYSATSNSEPDTPDTFTFAIFDNTGGEIPTTNPNSFDSFLELDLPANGAGSNTILSGSSGYSADIVPPTNQTAAPEPSAFSMLGVAALTILGLVSRRQGLRG